MKDVHVTSRMFPVGVCEEYNVRRILFDISGFRKDFGPGSPVLLITRPGEEQSYPISPEVEGDYAVWIPQQRDTDIPGSARVVLQWYVDGGLAISTEYYGRILGEKSSEGEVPEAEERWYREVLQAGEDAKSSAKRAEEAAERAENAESGGGSYDQEAIDAAVQEALTAAKESGMFDGPAGPAGPAGADGAPGADGKSAYQYAVEGGYTGTEAEFAAKLAAELPLDKEWVLKDTMMSPDQITVDFSGCTEFYIKGTVTATDATNLQCNYGSIIGNLTNNGARKVIAHFVQEQYGINPILCRYGGSTNTALTVLGTPYALYERNIDKISYLKFQTPSVVTECNLEIYAR